MIRKKKISQLPLSESLVGLYTIGVNAANKSVKVSLEWLKSVSDNVVDATKAAIEATKNAIKTTTDMRQLEATVEEKEEERENFYSRSQAMVQGWSNDEQNRKDTEAERVKNNALWERNEAVRIENNKRWEEREAIRVVEEELRKKNNALWENNEANRQRQEEQREEETTKAILNTEAATERLNNLSDHRDEIRDGYWWRWNEETGEWYNTGEIAKGNVMYATFDVDENNDLYMYTDEEYTGPGFEVDNEDLYVVLITE